MPTPKFPPDLPLPTRHTKPSWHNNAGNIDRAACLPISAKALWQFVVFNRGTPDPPYHHPR